MENYGNDTHDAPIPYKTYFWNGYRVTQIGLIFSGVFLIVDSLTLQLAHVNLGLGFQLMNFMSTACSLSAGLIFSRLADKRTKRDRETFNRPKKVLNDEI
jgi:hypothetical protein